MDQEILKQCWFLAGPTASGKSSAGICIAKEIGAEIISLDSMAIYQDMNIGTAKPSVTELTEISHHQIDIIVPSDEYSLAEYTADVEVCAKDILERNKIPLFVGGTGLYLRGVLRGVFDGPPADWEFRKKLEEESTSRDNDYLYLKLKKFDPVTAEKLHPNDQRRIIRAIEVHHLTGKPLSTQQNQVPLTKEEAPANIFWLQPPRERLYQRIDERVIDMFDLGLKEEVIELLTKYDNLSRTARQGLGYKEVIDFLEQVDSNYENESRNLDSVIELIQTRTRQFAKRQHTWFRNLVECKALEISGKETSEEVAQQYLEQAIS